MPQAITPDLSVAADPPHPASATPATAPDIVVPTIAVPANTRGIALKILAVIAVVGALALAQTLFVSLLLAIIMAYTLNPLVVYLERVRVPRAAGTIIVMMSMMSVLGFGAYSLRGFKYRDVASVLCRRLFDLGGGTLQLPHDSGGVDA